jgi:hypothetical protein
LRADEPVPAASAPPDPEAGAAFGGLLLDVQHRLESLYGLEPGAPVTDFVVPPDGASALPGTGSRTLVAEHEGELSLAVVFERSIREHLLRADPRARLDAANLGAFSTLTEEVSHFVYLLHSAQREKTVTQLELELQAEVDKYLTAAFLLGLQNEGAVSSGLRRLLFHSYRLAEGVTGERAERYHAASRLADRYCAWLERRFLRTARVDDLARETRRFYRFGQREKLEAIAGLH